MSTTIGKRNRDRALDFSNKHVGAKTRKFIAEVQKLSADNQKALLDTAVTTTLSASADVEVSSAEDDAESMYSDQVSSENLPLFNGR